MMGGRWRRLVVATVSVAVLLMWLSFYRMHFAALETKTTKPNNDGSSEQHGGATLRTRRRRIQQGQARQVPLFLSLYYVNDDTAQQLEDFENNPSNALVAHVCQSVNAQVCMVPKEYSYITMVYTARRYFLTLSWLFLIILLKHFSFCEFFTRTRTTQHQTGQWTASATSGRRRGRHLCHDHHDAAFGGPGFCLPNYRY